ncbi:MAG TPA: hypothetical protein VHL54_00435 [Actinomycetota bacterium]|nr:hypothetical protein [Actinomycetota bacterium]
MLHVAGPKLVFLSYIPRSKWLSFAGGISVSYVFLHLLPELSSGSAVVAERLGIPALSPHAVWVITLTSLVAFYGLESAALRSRTAKFGVRSTSPLLFWLSISSYAVYNLLIAYLLHEEAEQGVLSIALFVLAMGLHFVVNDLALQEHHRDRYASYGRWILVSSIFTGALIGALAQISEFVIVVATAIVAGGVVLNVLKEEVPAEAQSRFQSFVAGVLVYSVVLLVSG